jgi:hypothetical protein
MQFGLKDHVGDTLYISLAQMQTHSSHLTERERERESRTLMVLNRLYREHSR